MPSEDFLFSGAKVGVAVGGGGHDGGEGGVNGRRYGVVVGQSNVEVVGWGVPQRLRYWLGMLGSITSQR